LEGELNHRAYRRAL